MTSGTECGETTGAITKKCMRITSLARFERYKGK